MDGWMDGLDDLVENMEAKTGALKHIELLAGAEREASTGDLS